MFQDGLEECITEAVDLAPGETILFFVDDGHSKSGSLLMMQGMLNSSWPAQSIGQGERLRWK